MFPSTDCSFIAAEKLTMGLQTNAIEIAQFLLYTCTYGTAWLLKHPLDFCGEVIFYNPPLL